MALPRVLLVDDDTMVLIALVRLLGAHCKLDIVTENSAARALEMLDANRYDLLVVDLRLPGLTGDSILDIAARRWPRMRRAILTGAIDDWPENADAVLIKGTSPNDIAERICQLARFERCE